MVNSANNPSVARQVELIIRKLNSLSALPEVLSGFITRLGTGDLDVKAVSEIIENDPALTAKIFSMADRQGIAFNKRNPVVADVLSNMPSQAVRDAVMSMKVVDAFDADYDPDSKRILPRKQLGYHAIAVACCAKEIAAMVLGEKEKQLAFTAGLLHDVGKLAIEEAMPKSFEKIVKEARDTNASMSTVEQKHLGLDHAVIGKRLAQKWQLPNEVVMGIWLHHSDAEVITENIPGAKIAGVIRLADILARQGGFGISGSCDQCDGVAELAKALDISPGQLEQIKQRLASEVSRRGDLLGLSTPGGATAYCGLMHKTAAKLTHQNSELTTSNVQLAVNSANMTFVKDFLLGVNTSMTASDVAAKFAAGFKKQFQTGPVIVYLDAVENNGYIETVIADDSGNIDLNFVATPDDDSLDTIFGAGFAMIDAEGHFDWLFEQLDIIINTARSKAIALISKGKLVGGLIFEQRMPNDPAEQLEMFKLISAMGASVLDLAVVSTEAGRLAERFADILGRLKASRQKLLEGSTLTAIAETAAGAGHELNTPLAVISGRAQLLYEGETDENKKQMLKQITDRTKEISGIVTDLMNFANPKDADAKTISLSVLMAEAAEAAAQDGGLTMLDLNADDVDNLGDVLVDKQQIVTTLAAILLNASQSYASGTGPIKINGKCPQVPSMVTFQIIDTGQGMTAGTIDKATRPFFSARQAGRSRGMGLAHAERLLKLNNAGMQISSTPDSGTAVTLSLPKA
ncbi:MAG: HDOD domain-containing protein [Planctomycetes bacterium]|nr:HDOD domain-containing protein [Planctomycetota bacterium]